MSEKKKEATQLKPEALQGNDRAFYEELRAYRLEMAKKEDVSAFIVFYNRTLVDIVLKRPRNFEQLLRINGIGKVKAEKYGEKIIEIVKAFCDKEKMKSGQSPSETKQRQVEGKKDFSTRVNGETPEANRKTTGKKHQESPPAMGSPTSTPPDLYNSVLDLLRISLDDPTAEFRDDQWKAIEALTEQRKRLLIVQRTGWGKSVIYFLATRILRDRGAGPTLLISPLLALMRNQLIAAKRIGIRAATINSSNQEDWEKVRKELFADQVDILLISPERLANENFREQWLKTISDKIGLFVVDEAHCISDWGHDFRPDYLRVVRVLQALPPKIPVLATTATANDRVVEDVVEQLGPHLSVMRGALARKSLRLQNIALPSKAGRMAWLAEKLPSLPGSGVIYTLTIRDAQRLASWLQSKGIDAEAYWGGLAGEQRVLLEDRLLENRVKALVATTALGMGFDKPDLGFVIHFQRPGSV